VPAQAKKGSVSTLARNAAAGHSETQEDISSRKKTGSGVPFQNLFDITMNFLKNGKKLSPSNLNLLIVIRLWEYNL
jgi:hypothetical protein